MATGFVIFRSFCSGIRPCKTSMQNGIMCTMSHLLRPAFRHDIVAPASPGHQCSETSGAKARANWDRVLAGSRARNHAIACQCCDERSNETIVDRPLPFCPSP